MYKSFVNHPKSIIIAPAGYGKTHTIAESLNYTEDSQLILTHTNAGVASIRNKLRKLSNKNSYTVETICGFAQKYVHAFIPQIKIPEQDSSEYFPFIIKQANELFKIKLIKKIITINYKGLFVDEYQDCTLSQHELINALLEIIPTHVLGDPLQGIFDFNEEELVSFDRDLADYTITGTLEIPWRWKNTNKKLGEDLKFIRQKLEKGEKVNLLETRNIEKYKVNEVDLYTYGKTYNSKLWSLIRNESSLLLIYPQSHNLNGRLKVIKTFGNILNLVEAMDGAEFYTFSKMIDSTTSETIYSTLHSLSESLFNKTAVNKWFGATSFINKREEKEKSIIEPIKSIIEELKESISFNKISKVLLLIKELPKIKCYRKELFKDLRKAMDNAWLQQESVFDSMTKIRNTKRHIGKSIQGKNIGTTLLTKGLEFDTVVILNAQKIDCPKNFYVAVTRATKRLVVFSNNLELTFK